MRRRNRPLGTVSLTERRAAPATPRSAGTPPEPAAAVRGAGRRRPTGKVRRARVPSPGAPRTFAELPVPDGDDGPCVLAVVDEPQRERLHALLGVAQLRQLLLQRRLREGGHGGGPARAGPAPPAGEGATQPHRRQAATAAATRWPPDLSPRLGGSKGSIVRIARGRRGEPLRPAQTTHAGRGGGDGSTAHARPHRRRPPRRHGRRMRIAGTRDFSHNSPPAERRWALFVALPGPATRTSLPARGRSATGAGRRAGPQGPPRAGSP